MKDACLLFGCALAVALAAPLLACAQAAPAAGTQAVAAPAARGPATTTPPAPTEPHPAAAATQHLEVQYTAGKLAVDAGNASLNEILRQIAHKSGLKIVGGVQDEIVYGHYGPASVSEVLATLLDGTGSNFLLVGGPDQVRELILMPRQGGTSAMNPVVVQSNSPPLDPERGGTYPEPAPYESQAGPQPGNNEAHAQNDGSGQSPNGTKTPQQIYEEMQQIRQNPPQSSTPPAAPP